VQSRRTAQLYKEGFKKKMKEKRKYTTNSTTRQVSESQKGDAINTY
jgi:hypothetical protein